MMGLDLPLKCSRSAWARASEVAVSRLRLH